MALTMGQIKRLLAAQGNSSVAAQQKVAAQLVADALLRGVARQAIIAAAADAVAQLQSGVTVDELSLIIGGRPGGPSDDGNPKNENSDPGPRTTGP